MIFVWLPVLAAVVLLLCLPLLRYRVVRTSDTSTRTSRTSQRTDAVHVITTAVR